MGKKTPSGRFSSRFTSRNGLTAGHEDPDQAAVLFREEIDMENRPTCGKGLAEHAALPAKLGELLGVMAENLELHMRALDLGNGDARKEHDAYLNLAKKHRAISAELHATAAEMGSYGTLPMGPHDERALSDPKVTDVFERFVNQERDLLALLTERVERDLKILGLMRAER
jgi:hypothetical protein